jgi:hypothetical protein
MMPTNRPRYQVTETDQIGRALDLAEGRWPGESRAKLLVRLIAAGIETIEEHRSDERESRRRAVRRTSGAYDDAFHENYLAELRQDWPA